MNCNWGGWGYQLNGSLLWLIGLVILVIFIVIRTRHQKVEPHSGCSTCGGTIQPAFMRCPHCGNGLKGHCPNCSRIVESSWHYCPDCRADLKQN